MTRALLFLQIFLRKARSSAGQGPVFEELQEFVVPSSCPQAEKLCARGIAEVRRMDLAGGEIPKEPAIHGSQADGVRRLSHGFDSLE